MVDMRAVLAHVLKNAFGIPDPGRFILPDPMAQQQMGMPPEPEPDPEAENPDEAGGAPLPIDPAMLQGVNGSPPGGYGMNQDGGIPPELLAQLAGQVGLSV
jgi:hypothetical protein